jgi:CRISPR-associated protein Csb2
MRLVLYQEFPLGRFHATPWRANPFDDPHGEWPPSPWRLVRAVVARWYQWAREAESDLDFDELDCLVAALCASTYCFHLPVHARKGSPLRQYFPGEFGWNPKAKKKAGVRSYGTSLAQDNYWCVAPDEPVWWFLEGDQWTEPLVSVLDRCLERLTYLGRAETLTRIRRASDKAPDPNCVLVEQRGPGAVPVLTPRADATRVDVERVTDDPDAVTRPVPPGACTLYAVRPARPSSHERRETPPVRRDCQLLQFAVGWNVAPEARAIVRLTARFRGAVLRELLRIKTGDSKATWSRVDREIRDAVADMLGKDAEGKPLTGPHRHAEFFAWCEDGVPTRLLVWRSVRPFDEHEQEAILRAASRDVSWAAAGSDTDAWKVRLIALDRAVPPPAGFDGVHARRWESVTPYVLPRHHLRAGRVRENESLIAQVRRELRQRGFNDAERVEVELIGEAEWAAVHVPRRQANQRAFLGDRRGQLIALTFPEPVTGPLRLGHSSSFGLGLFRPREEVK